jgi:hypothetical protein
LAPVAEALRSLDHKKDGSSFRCAGVVGRAGALLAAGVLLATSGLALAEDHQLACGKLSPFANQCTDGPKQLNGSKPQFTWNLLGFTGKLRIQLVQFGIAVYTQDCWSIVAPSVENNPLVASCAPGHGFWIPNHDAYLVCTAYSVTYSDLAGAGYVPDLGPNNPDGLPLQPAGTWGCEADF